VAKLNLALMSRRLFAAIIPLFVVGCASSQEYSRPGVHPYSDLPTSHEPEGVDEPSTEQAPASRGEQERTQPGEADPLRQQCRDTREAREKDKRAGQQAFDQYRADQDRVMPWFKQHCHLAQVVVTRKAGDRFESKPESVMQCDTEEGRPKGLTEQFVAEHQAAITTPDQFYHQDFRELHYLCAPYDAREPR
jgi:hypothetical protein